MSQEIGNQMVGYITVFAVGAALGAGLALLYAPHSGRETRELIAHKAQDLKDQAAKAFDDARDTVLEKKAELTAAVEAGKEAVRDQRARHASPA